MVKNKRKQVGGFREKITQGQRKAIYLLNESGFNNHEIGRLTGLSTSVVWKYVKEFGNDSHGLTTCSILKMSEGHIKGNTKNERTRRVHKVGETIKKEYEEYIKLCIEIIEWIEKETGTVLMRNW